MWYNDAKLLSGLGQALATATILEDSDDFTAYMAKPQRYDEFYDAWKEAGYPTAEDDDGWEDFVNAVSEDEEESE